jgi:N-acetylglucosaminyldiphosphoundecaprenol N-acetyl-beta-D-mannosaminyltransferase
MGVPFHDVTFAETVTWAEDHIARGQPGYIATANLDFVMQAQRDPELQRILFEADLVVADGAPLVRLSSRLGPRLRERVTGSDLTPMLAELCARRGWPIFALGGAAGVAERALAGLRQRYPGLPAGATYSPPLAGILEMDHAAILERLNAAKPALLLVAFGAPKQEKWINMHFRQWRVPLAIGVGGTLDFLAGAQTRAPRWVQRIGLEWLWRMGTNPRRLFKRYAANALFLVAAIGRLAWLRHAAVAAAAAPESDPAPAPDRLADLRARIVLWQPLPDLASAMTRRQELSAVTSQATLVFDLAPAAWLKSHELGLLVALQAEARTRGPGVILWRPGPRLLRLLREYRLDTYFQIAPRAADWTARLQAAKAAGRAGAVACDAQGRLRLVLPAELTAANLPAYRARYEQALPPGGAAAVAGWEVDAGQLQFIDSAALGFLVALQKAAAHNRRAFAAAGWGEIPRRILKTARLENLLAPANPASSAG